MVLRAILWLVAVHGFVQIVTMGEIFAPLRRSLPQSFPFGAIRCPQCFGWWAGLGVGAVYPIVPADGHGWASRLAGAAVCAFIASAWCSFADAFQVTILGVGRPSDHPHHEAE